MGVYVPLEKTVDGFARILSGEADELAETELMFSGDLDSVLTRHKE